MVLIEEPRFISLSKYNLLGGYFVRKVLPFLAPYRVAAMVSIVLMLVELMVELLQPLIMARIIDHGIMMENLSVVIVWGSVLIVFTIASLTAGIVTSFYSSHVSQGYAFDVRSRLYGKIQSFTFANFNRFPTSSLITRMTNDVSQIQNTIFMCLRIALRAPLLVIGGVVMALIIDVKLALILVAVVPLLILLLTWVMKMTSRLFRRVQQGVDDVNNVMQENLSGIRIIKAFLRRNHEVKRFDQSSEVLKVRTVNALRTVELTMPAVLLLMNLSVIVILWFGSKEISVGGASVGEVVAVINYAVRVTMALSMTSWIIMALSRGKASLDRVSEVLDMNEDFVDGTDHVDGDSAPLIHDGRIVFDAVSFRYPTADSLMLHDISFKVEAGETVAILGATGSGKTSLFQLIPRLYEVEEGAILIDDVDIRSMTAEHLRMSIGFVPQEALLFTGTVRENIEWGKEAATDEEMIEAAKRAQIHDTIMKLPHQYNTVVGQRGVNLSGGQKQRLSIARALVRKPKLLLLDDSTSALDVKTEEKLLQAIGELACTTMMITQKMSTAMKADKILLIEDGTLLDHGAHGELLERSDLYRRIYESQMGKEATQHA
jgi:ATP-binding cassette subfamily B multidrug efflux pump